MGVIAELGDVFEVPIAAGTVGLGIVAAQGNSDLYLVVFDGQFGAGATPGDVEGLDPLLASISLDAKIWHGHWPIVGNSSDTTRILQPLYKVREPAGWIAESFDRKFRRPIHEATASKLRFRKCVAPVRLERALKAFAGIGAWIPAYDELLYAEVLRTRGVHATIRRDHEGNAQSLASRTASPHREPPLFLYVKIPGHVEPLERRAKFEGPLHATLENAGLGEVTGGGSQLGDPDPDGRRTIQFCGIDVDLYDLERGIALVRRELTRLKAPNGTLLLYEIAGQEHRQILGEA